MIATSGDAMGNLSLVLFMDIEVIQCRLLNFKTPFQGLPSQKTSFPAMLTKLQCDITVWTELILRLFKSLVTFIFSPIKIMTTKGIYMHVMLPQESIDELSMENAWKTNIYLNTRTSVCRCVLHVCCLS